MGFGSSAKPSSLVYEPKLWYEQVADFIREVVGEPCVLIGNSIGSQVMQTQYRKSHSSVSPGEVVVISASTSQLNHSSLVKEQELAQIFTAKSTRGRDRTCDLLFRKQAPYPLGHASSLIILIFSILYSEIKRNQKAGASR